MKPVSFKEFLNRKETTPKQLSKKFHVSVKSLLDQLKLGIKTEMEHTTNKTIARKIAMDHLKEDPKYYSKLRKMEKKKK